MGLELNAGNLDVGVQVYAGVGTVQSNYVSIFVDASTYGRQACCHPMLVKKCNKTQTAQTTAVYKVQKH